MGRADETVGEVSFDVSFHGHQLHRKHAVDAAPGRLGVGQHGDLQVVLAMGQERVGLLLREDIEVVVVSCRNLCEKVGVGWGRGVGKMRRGSASKGGRGYRKRRGMEVRGRRGGEGGGRGQAGGSAEGGVERQHALRPIDAGIVVLQPRNSQDKLEVAKFGDLEGECLCESPMNAEMGGEVVCNGTSSKDTTIDQIQRYGDRMGKGVQVKANEDGGVQEAIGGSRVDQY